MMQEVTNAVVPYYTVERLILLITTIANAIIFIRTNWMVKQNSQNLKENTDITHATLTKATLIETHVNGERSKLDEQLASKDREIELLKGELAEHNRRAAIQTQVTAAVVGQRRADPATSQNRRAEDKA